MSEQSAVQTLEKLVMEVDGERKDVVLESSRDFYDLDHYEEMEEVETEYVQKHRLAVEEVISAWGQPEFFGTPDDDLFPAWAEDEAAAFAFWRRGSQKVAYLSVLKHDQETPYFLMAGASPSV